MKRFMYLAICLLLLTTSCNKLNDLFNGGGSDGLSSDEIVQGLKTALTVGSDTAVVKTSATNGFYGNAALKILLPTEAKVVVDNISSVPLGTEMMEKVVLCVNRSAEDACKEAKPILVDAITSMSITDGLSILNGKNPASKKKGLDNEFDSTAATNYLKSKTLASLTAAFKPKIDASLNKKIVDGVTTYDAWDKLSLAYNIYATLAGKSSIGNVDFGTYVTGKALDGLFVKVGEQEKGIRRNPLNWLSDILRKVFGSVFKA